MDTLSIPELECAKQLIYSVDLSSVIERLCRVEHWSKSQAIVACEQYRNYLFLKKKYGDTCELPPSVDIDEVWHVHILHTQDYSEFSQKIFGGFLHHHPHHGVGNTISQEQLEHMFETQTQRLYHLEFGEYIYAIKRVPFAKIILRLLRRFLFAKPLVAMDSSRDNS